jgi:hypothetical protein
MGRRVGSRLRRLDHLTPLALVYPVQMIGLECCAF